MALPVRFFGCVRTFRFRTWAFALATLACSAGSPTALAEPATASPTPVVTPTPSTSPAAEKQEPSFDPGGQSPYFTDKSIASAAAVIQSGKGSLSLALKSLPAKTDSLQILYLKVQAYEALNDDASAARLAEELAEKYPEMSARLHCIAAGAFERLGDTLGAQKHIDACATDPIRGRSAVITKARLLAKTGKKDEALKLLDGVTNSARIEAMAAKAQLLVDMGQSKGALEVYRDIYLNEPLSPFADRAKERAKELTKKLKASPPSVEQLAIRVEKLLAANKLKQAVSAATELPAKVSVCSGATCAVTRCLPTESTASAVAEMSDEAMAHNEAADLPAELETVVPPKPFLLAKVKDPEDTEAAPALPKCAIEMPEKPADPGTCRVQLVRGWIAKKQKDHTKAVSLLRPVYERCSDPEVRAQALAQAAGSAKQLADSDAYALGLIAGVQFLSSSVADDALMTAASIAKDAGDPKAERAALRFLVKKLPDSSQRAEALFRLFWSHRFEGRPDRGLGYLEQLAKDYDGQRGDGADSDRGRYWWGRTVAVSAVKADRAKGLDVLSALSRQRPFTFYGVLARSFLTSVNPSTPAAPELVAPHAGALKLGLLATDRAFLSAVELWRMGDLDEARTALSSVDYRALRADGMRGQESILIIAEIIQKLGDVRGAHAVARRDLLRIIREGANPIGRRAALVCYPVVFRSPIELHTGEAGFDADFLQGLMREESALDPRAKSPVGARGLTQVMPATGKAVAHSIGMKKFRADDLWTPETNIKIGSIYLGRMLRQFGHPGLAAAAYNAGPHRVKQWLTGPKVPFDEFVERIPFSETRGYVKRVLRSYATYQYLYGEKAKLVQVNMGLRSPGADE